MLDPLALEFVDLYGRLRGRGSLRHWPQQGQPDSVFSRNLDGFATRLACVRRFVQRATAAGAPLSTSPGNRKQRRIERNRKKAARPEGKVLATLKPSKLPTKVRRQLPMLCGGAFVDRAENLLAFGLPGRGKTHLLCAIAHEPVQRDFTVWFTPAYQLVQQLLAAKRELTLQRELQRLDCYDVVVVDYIGYIQQDREEMEVLFTFLSQRHERRSVMITSNLVSSQWDKIFKDPMTNAAAIDRVVHHSIILELTGPSVRSQEAQMKNQTKAEENPESQTEPL